MWVMRGDNDHPRPLGRQSLWMEQRVQLARGHWRRAERAGAIRSTGWWESVTVTLSPAPTPGRRSPLLHRALVAASEAIAPPLADLVAATARRVLERHYGPRAATPSLRRKLPTATRALPAPARPPD